MDGCVVVANLRTEFVSADLRKLQSHPIDVPGVSVGRLRDGKICSNRDYWNGAAYKVPNT